MIAPVFPRGALFSPDVLYERAQQLDRQAHRVVRDFRLVHGGIMSGRATDPRQTYHFALSTHGVLLLEELISPAEHVDEIPVVYLYQLGRPVIRAVQTAVSFFDGSLTNLMIRCELIDCRSYAYLQSDPRQMIMPAEVAARQRCLDPEIRVLAYTAAETLRARQAELLAEILEPILWAFSHRATGLRQQIETGLLTQRFV